MSGYDGRLVYLKGYREWCDAGFAAGLGVQIGGVSRQSPVVGEFLV